MKTRNKIIKILLLLTLSIVLCLNFTACGGPAGKTYKLKAIILEEEIIICGDKSYYREINENYITIKFEKNGTFKMIMGREMVDENSQLLKGAWDWDKEYPDTIYITLGLLNEEKPEQYVARIIGKELLVSFIGADGFGLLMQQS